MNLGKEFMSCPHCACDVHWYEGHPELDTYLAFSCDQEGSTIDEVELLPRMDRVDEVKDDRFYMCSNGNCMMVWEEEKDIETLKKSQSMIKKCIACSLAFTESEFCENCGAKLIEINSDVFECNTCKKLYVDSEFCPEDGQKLSLFKSFEIKGVQSTTSSSSNETKPELNLESVPINSSEIPEELDAQELFKALCRMLPDYEYLVFTWSGGGDSFGGFELVQSKVSGEVITSHDADLVSKIQKAVDSSTILYDMDLSVNCVDQGWSEGLLLIALKPLSDYFYYEDQVYMEEEEGFKGYSINGRNHEDIGGYIEV